MPLLTSQGPIKLFFRLDDKLNCICVLLFTLELAVSLEVEVNKTNSVKVEVPSLDARR